MPFPSDTWYDADARQVRLNPEAMPMSAGGVPMSIEAFARDGFGTASPVIFQLPGATSAGAPPVFDPAASLLPDSHTVLLRADTGERIPHWLEADYLDAAKDPQVYILRPAVPLPRGVRVIVGLRGFVDEAGEPVEVPEGFAALRDATASRLRGVHARRAHYEADIFPALAEAGFERDELQLAWDFTVATDAALDTLLNLRDDLYAAIGEAGPAYTIDQIETMSDPNIAFVLHMTAQVPSFVGAPDENGLRRLNPRDADGHVTSSGFESVPFRLQIPHSLVDGEGPFPTLNYGHGFLGSMNEANNGWLRGMAQRYGFAILAASYQGMNDGNLPVWIATLGADAGSFPLISHEAMQGTLNHLALHRLIRGGALPADPALLREDGSGLLDDGTLWYYGNSQGGTQGALVNALTKDVDRAVLGVPGCAYPFLLHRSTVFAGYAVVISAIYPEPGDQSMFLTLAGTGMDDFDPLGFASHLVNDRFEGAPDRDVLLHVAKEDAQVQNEVSFLLGRAIGTVQPEETVREIWGLPSAPYPLEGPASIVEFDFGVPDDATPLDPPVDETDTHSTLRNDPIGQEQMMTFLRTGSVPDSCGGPCRIGGQP
jgi:hypothetical protein